MTDQGSKSQDVTRTPSTKATQDAEGRKPTLEEAEAMLTLVRGGWLKIELAL